MINVLFVCLGNICRSPLAEAIFNEKVRISDLSNKISSDSAGTAAYHIGEKPDPRSIEVAQKHNIPISHRGQQFLAEHENEFDYLIAMDDSNYRNMVVEMGNDPKKLFKMRHFDSIGKNSDVPDPYYGGKDGFEEVYQILDRSTEALLQFIKREHNL